MICSITIMLVGLVGDLYTTADDTRTQTSISCFVIQIDQLGKVVRSWDMKDRAMHSVQYETGQETRRGCSE